MVKPIIAVMRCICNFEVTCSPRHGKLHVLLEKLITVRHQWIVMFSGTIPRWKAGVPSTLVGETDLSRQVEVNRWAPAMVRELVTLAPANHGGRSIQVPASEGNSSLKLGSGTEAPAARFWMGAHLW